MSTPVLHRAAGLIVSADTRLPGFVPVDDSRRPDVCVHLRAEPSWQAQDSTLRYSAGRLDDGTPIVQVFRSSDGFHFRYGDGTRFWIDASGVEVWSTWPASASLEDTCTYLCGPILGLILRLRGALALHASAVRIGDGAIAFVGPHGAGKSTLAAALGAAGCAIVTDDVLHVRLDRSEWVVEPFTAMLKLWPEGVELALGPRVSLPVITAGWDKRALHIGADVLGVSEPVAVRAIACLTSRAAVAVIEPLPAGEAFVRLSANSSAAHLLDSTARAREFRTLTALVRSVPCVSLTGSDAPQSYPQFVSRVLEWARGCGVAATR